jgi:hypothetical protein
MKIASLEDQKSPKNAKIVNFGRQGDTYLVCVRIPDLYISDSVNYYQAFGVNI